MREEKRGGEIRPVVVILVERRHEGELNVLVVPVTHEDPSDPAGAVEIQQAVKRHLELDAERSWIVVSEGNEFVWPGYDVFKRPRTNRYDYGFLPPKLFDQVRRAFLGWRKAKKAVIAPR